MKAPPLRSQRTPRHKADEKAMRNYFQRERPSLEQVLASGEYDGPFEHGQYVEMRVALAKLKKEREKAGLSLSQVAKKSGIDKGALSRIENGLQANPTLDTLYRYAHALGKELNFTIK